MENPLQVYFNQRHIFLDSSDISAFTFNAHKRIKYKLSGTLLYNIIKNKNNQLKF